MENGHEQEPEKLKVIHIPIVMENGFDPTNSKNNEAGNAEDVVCNHKNLDIPNVLESNSTTSKKNSESKDVVTKYSRTESVLKHIDNNVSEHKNTDSKQFTAPVNENLNGKCDNCSDANIRPVKIQSDCEFFKFSNR